MAEELHDGEFWLPSEFLTDDDIVSGFGSSSTETEISDDDSPFHSKLPVLSTSPQSTLFGCEFNQGSSLGTPHHKEADNKYQQDDHTATLDLLNKAAGEVAKMKLMSSVRSTGTGFFDCRNSVKGLKYPSPPPPPFYSHHHPHFPPHMMWGQVHLPQQQQNRVTKNNSSSTKSNNNNSNNRPLGLPPSAWPPLTGQAQTQIQAQPQPQTKPVGTGVFLPRRVATPAEPKKKSDIKVVKTKNNKGSQGRHSRPIKGSDDEIQLPSEWVY